MIKEIETRRSIRKYIDKEITKEDLKDLLVAAMHAPTARNLQSWRFIASNNRKVLDDLAKIPAYQMLSTAGAVIVVMGDLDVDNEVFNYVNASAAVQNILLEAQNKGIGTCWCAIGPREDRMNAIKDYFKLKDNLLPIALISIGYPDEIKGIEDRYDENKIIWL